jgi:hypothetical protein
VAAGPDDPEIESYLVPIAGTLEIARQLRERGLRVGILSNDSREMSRARRRKHGFDDVFDPILISSEIGQLKPGPGIYDHALAHRLAGGAAVRRQPRKNVEALRRGMGDPLTARRSCGASRGAGAALNGRADPAVQDGADRPVLEDWPGRPPLPAADRHRGGDARYGCSYTCRLGWRR